MEGFLDVTEADRLGDEIVERKPTLQVEIDQERKITVRQAVAVPARLQGTASSEEFDHGYVGKLHRRRRNTHLNDRPGEIAREESLPQHLGMPDGFHADVGAVAVGGSLNGRDRISLLAVDRVGGAEPSRPFELAVVDIDGRRIWRRS